MRKKDFDCVRMKHEIQQRLLKQMKGLSPQEQIQWTEEFISQDNLLGPFWKKARKIELEDISPPKTGGKTRLSRRSLRGRG